MASTRPTIFIFPSNSVDYMILFFARGHSYCCDNYFTVTADLKLLPSAGSDRAWVWNPQADYADEEAKPEQLAIRFANAESEYTIYCSQYTIYFSKYTIYYSE